MPLELFDEGSTRSLMADWVEASVFSTGSRVSHADLRRSGSVREDPVHGREYDEETGEMLDAEILETKADAAAQAVWLELQHRQTLLGSSYPFRLSKRANGAWSLELAAKDQAADLARRCYLACLMIAAMRRKVLPKAKKDWEKSLRDSYRSIEKSAPDVFQAVSYLVGPAMIGGTAYWFGWPRPDGTKSLRSAIDQLVERLGHGKVKAKDPEWTKKAQKDGTIDIVIWRPFVDGQYGSVVVFGQVASGENWRGKSVATFIKGHFFDWFEDVPADSYLPAMFMPFLLHDEAKDSKDATFKEMARGSARRDERDFGVIIDRIRLTELAANRLEAAADWTDQEKFLVTKITRWLALARKYSMAELKLAVAE